MVLNTPVISNKLFGSSELCDKVLLATASYDHDIKLWQAHTGVCERTLQHPESVSDVNFFRGLMYLF